MIPLLLASDGALARQLLVVVTIAAVVLAAVLARGRTGRLVAGTLAVSTFGAVLALTLSPDPVSGPGAGGCAVDVDDPLTDVPNMVLFLVPVLFAVVATRRPLPFLLLGPLLSAAIELGQTLLPVVGRRCDADDLVANSAGSVVAVILGAVIVWATRRRPGAQGTDVPPRTEAGRPAELSGAR